MAIASSTFTAATSPPGWPTWAAQAYGHRSEPLPRIPLPRVLFAVFFVVAGIGHIRQGQMIAGYARSKGVPLASLGGWPVGVVLLVGSASIILGVWPDIGALLLALWVIVAAVLVHNFWTVQDPQQRQMELQNFNRNITYLGGALALLAIFVSQADALKFSFTGPLIHF
jgi:uncharacterized membrane protein YphA (DoxX/SURF4 family)